MKFVHRFAYYSFGLMIGMVFLFMFLNGKDMSCSYFPNARVLKDIRSKPFYYSDESKVKEVRAKLERAGFKTYVHVAQLKEGKRTRVRIGPFDSKDEAQQTVKKIKALNFTAAVLTL